MDGLGQALPELIPAAVNAITTIVQGLVDNLPMLLECSTAVNTWFGPGATRNDPQLIEALPYDYFGNR